MNDPEVVFFDEPTTGLDPKARREVWEVLQGLKRQGKTVLLTTHYMEEAELLADRVAIISRGKIIALGSPAELVEKHATSPLLTLQSADARVPEILRAMGFQPVLDHGGDIIVALKRTDDLREMLNAVKDAGACCSALNLRRSNLEEVFLKLTGEALHDGPARGGGAS